MRRRLLNAVTALSLLLCAAVVVVWVRSYQPFESEGQRFDAGFAGFEKFHADDRTGTWYRFGLWLADGRVALGEFVVVYDDRWGIVSVREQQSRAGPALKMDVANYHFDSVSTLGRLGFFAGRTPYIGRSSYLRGVATPCWFLALALASPPLVWIILRLCRPLARFGLCPACGYDLAGNVSGVCPSVAILQGEISLNAFRRLGIVGVVGFAVSCTRPRGGVI
jgi:hypothetical protein